MCYNIKADTEVKKMRVVSLAENTASKSGFETEHGLSLYIETQNKKILFDMGQTALFSENAAKLGIDLSAVDFAVLSHGHYDHGGGLKKFLEINSTAPVYLSRYAFGQHYNGTEKYIGLDVDLKTNERLVFVGDELEIQKGFTLYSCNQKEKKYDLGSFGLNMVENEKFVPDDFRHEQYLLIEENSERVLISGCSHKGIMDIAAWFMPDCLIGGFHFSKLGCDETLRKYAEFLDNLGTEFYTCHCTGVPQYEFMKKYMKNLNYIATGDKINI